MVVGHWHGHEKGIIEREYDSAIIKVVLPLVFVSIAC